MGVVSALLKFAQVDWVLYDWDTSWGAAVASGPFLFIVIYMLRSSMKTKTE